MGWTFPYGYNRRQLIEERCRGWGDTKGNWHLVCLAKCYKGSSWRGTLWIVWGFEKTDPSKPAEFPFEGKPWIECDLLEYSKRDNGWGYKDMEESMHPYNYNCPLKYLEMAPEACNEWRQGVIAHHERRRARLKYKRDQEKAYETRKRSLTPA